VAELEGIYVLDGPGNSHYCLSAVLDAQLGERRADIVAGLTAGGIGTSLYYPQPVPRMGYYREKYGYEASAYPNATAISDRSIALPVGPHLADGDAAFIAGVLRGLVEETL
jgi:perosamine synthetase